MTRRFEPLQAPLPLPGGLVGGLGALIERAMLTMFHSRQECPLGGTVTVQFVGDDHAGNGGEALEQLLEESLRRFLVPPALHQNIEEMSVLIHRTPEILALTPNGEKHFIEVPLVAPSGTAAPELMGI
jgi:hypothetical protein